MFYPKCTENSGMCYEILEDAAWENMMYAWKIFGVGKNLSGKRWSISQETQIKGVFENMRKLIKM